MALKVEVWSDFISPFCYFVSHTLEKLEQHYDLHVNWRSYELHPRGESLVDLGHQVHVDADLDQVARNQYGLLLNMGPLGIDSHDAHLGYQYAMLVGKSIAYQRAVMAAYWQKGQDISNRAVLEQIAAQIGLDAMAFSLAFSDPMYAELVKKDQLEASMYRISDVPTLLFDARYMVSGAQPYQIFEEVLHKLDVL